MASSTVFRRLVFSKELSSHCSAETQRAFSESEATPRAHNNESRRAHSFPIAAAPVGLSPMDDAPASTV